jgi:2-phospho-L-lactate guanylyltransferase
MLEQAAPRQVRWHALIPAKALHNSKSRLDRNDLTGPFLADTASALIGSTHVAQLTVITADMEVASLVENLGGKAIMEVNSTGLLDALDLGLESIANVSPDVGILIALGDLPCLRTQDVDQFLEQAAHHDSSFTSDAEGTGSTMWARLPGSSAKPRFGIRSRAAHRMHGAVEIQCSAGAHRDVDTSTDLWDAIRIGVGTHTSQALSTQLVYSATISGTNPITAVNELGVQSSYPDYTISGMIAPRIGQRIRIDSINKQISL